MNIVFDFLKYNTLYERCVMASVAHAIMVGKYNLLEISKLDNTYDFSKEDKKFYKKFKPYFDNIDSLTIKKD